METITQQKEIMHKTYAINKRIFNVINTYGYTCELDYTYKIDDTDIIEYSKIKIYDGDECIKSLYIYSNINVFNGKASYSDTDIKIYLEYRYKYIPKGIEIPNGPIIYYRAEWIADSNNLEKFITNLIVEYLKEQEEFKLQFNQLINS